MTVGILEIDDNYGDMCNRQVFTNVSWEGLMELACDYINEEIEESIMYSQQLEYEGDIFPYDWWYGMTKNEMFVYLSARCLLDVYEAIEFNQD